jgi:hypothetical protein
LEYLTAVMEPGGGTLVYSIKGILDKSNDRVDRIESKGIFTLGVMIWVGPQITHDQTREGVVCPSPRQLRNLHLLFLFVGEVVISFPSQMKVQSFDTRCEFVGHTEMYGRFEGCNIVQHG